MSRPEFLWYIRLDRAILLDQMKYCWRSHWAGGKCFLILPTGGLMVVLRKCKKQQNRLVELKNSKCLPSLCEEASCSFILHWDIPCPQNISPAVVMNCIALLVVRVRVFCWGAIWFPFILICLWHQENCWDSTGKRLHLGLQPDCDYLCEVMTTFFPSKKQSCVKMLCMLGF
jgi:hypothetical protein